MSPRTHEFPYELTRAAFSARDAARAGDVWRACQDVAVRAASLSGWPPRRLRDVGSAFVVRTMVAVHHRETRFGETLGARSWVSDARRDTITVRELRLGNEEGPVVSATQQWVHVGAAGLARMPPEMAADLAPVDGGGPVALPAYERCESSVVHEFAFRTFHTWMDPLAHVNHPQYVDFCDEAISQRMAARGLSPLSLSPLAEEVTFRVPVLADELVTVSTRVVGRLGGALVLAHRIGTERDPRCTDVITIRKVVDADPDAFVEAFLEP